MITKGLALMTTSDAAENTRGTRAVTAVLPGDRHLVLHLRHIA
jgi:hypothetical protein